MARLLWLLPLGLLQACAGTPVAEQLERSFAVPEAKPAQAAEPIPAVKTSPPVASPTAERPLEPVPKPAPKPEAEEALEPVPEQATRPVPSQAQPQEPYRITIRLAGADPAAPAEAVTRALREADVGFAVERIERVEP
ncbi:hypothetical protein KR52_14005 [Synechococcus sp. KORDI-52]|uniref:hypothetical protein n=1 Tax=Synechococcus sp. KORDI-52 TaxID=585425 RepID=UPI0004E06241|nr:hypothetical protein [Synechococcus sp. KORDI-52]AII50236.1 hypothetical protein KR52_14005 [Synechococcus sp. KORDI-52]